MAQYAPTIRQATDSDAHDVARIHVESWRAANAGLLPQDILDGLDVDYRAARWREWIARSEAGLPTEGGKEGPSHRLFLALVDDSVVGWAGFGAVRDTQYAGQGELAGLYVHPASWSTGAGHALIEQVESDLKAAGFETAYLWVLAGNERAIAFYERHRWHADGVEKLDSAGGVDNLRELRHVRTL